MSHLVNLNDATYAAEIDAEIDHIRQSGALGRSAQLEALFDYLVERSRAGSPPREIEIAQDVFAGSQFAAQDGTSRVYIHRLRGRLKEHNASSDRPVRITLPLGQYRLEADVGFAEDESSEEGSAEVIPQSQSQPQPVPEIPRRPRRLSLTSAAISTFAALIVGVLLGAVYIFGERDLDVDLRNSAVWASLLNASGGSVVVEGNYYMFAESSASSPTARLIHDPMINSSEDLDAYLVRNPDKVDVYRDVGLNYVPYSVPFAQHRLSPMIARLPNAQISMMTHTTPGRLLMQNVVYIGLTSGLGLLTDPVFAGSRFRLGKNSGEIRDFASNRNYVGTSATESHEGQQRQYGLLSSFAGGRGNRYLVLAGTADLALIGLSQVVMDASALAPLEPYATKNQSFEALYEIEGQHTVITSLKLLAVSRRDPRKIWAAE
jgi:hypothetical protein